MATAASKYDRIIVLVDMDCFYCQVEEKINPLLKGKAIAVVQYNAWKGGGIIAVNYPARDRGVTRHMRGDEAKEHCPDIELVKVPNVREKADLSKYRDAGKEVASVLQTYTPLLERASVDEAYMDITENVMVRLKDMNKGEFVLKPDKLLSTYVVGCDSIGKFVQSISVSMKDGCADNDASDFDDFIPNNQNDIKLLIGASICNEIRAAVKEKTGYDCSAGIAHNKILAKLVCGLNKPNKQTLLPLRYIKELYSTLSIKKIKGLGGKFGDDVCDGLNIKLMADLAKFTQEDLQKRFDEKNGLWLYLIGRGIDLEPVTPRFSSKSIGCCKKFPGRTSIKSVSTLEHWLSELAQEIFERIEKDEIENNRRPKQMVVSFTQEFNHDDVASSRSVPLTSMDVDRMATDALEVIKKNSQVFLKPDQLIVLQNPIKFLGISVGKFEDLDQKQKNTIDSMFSKQVKRAEEQLETTKIQRVIPTASNVGSSDDSCAMCVEGVEEVPSAGSLSFDESAEETISDSKISAADNGDQRDINIPSTVEQPQPDLRPSFFASRVARVEVMVHDDQPNNKEIVQSKPDLRQSFFASKIAAKNETANTNAFPSGPVPENITVSNCEVSNCEVGESSSSVAEASKTADYTTTYAEFHRPPIIPDIFEKCVQCNKKVLLSDLQSHADAHFAFQISQQQRTEFRNQIKPKLTPPAAKKQKIDRSSTAVSTSNSTSLASTTLINKFLVKSQSPSAASAGSEEVIIDLLNDNQERCEECGQYINTDKIIEHADYHAAKKLQMELNKEMSLSTTKSVATKSSNAKKKTKSKNANTVAVPTVPSVAAFFKQVN